MAGTIAHLVIANKIFDKIERDIYDPFAFYIGTIAPDTIESKEQATREDKMHSHLRNDIKYMNWLKNENQELFQKRVKNFIFDYILNNSIYEKDIYLGYVVHLLTDEYYHKVIRSELLKYVDENDKDKEILPIMTNELYAMDFYLIKKYPKIKKLVNDLASSNRKFEVKPYVTEHFINKSLDWILNNYLLNIQNRMPMQITFKCMDQFVDETVDLIINQLSLGEKYPVLLSRN